MPNFETMNREELKTALDRAQAFEQDAKDERSFLGKQTSMHIKVSEFDRLDQDIEKFGGHVQQIEALIANHSA
jgi:hypothetical protein